MDTASLASVGSFKVAMLCVGNQRSYSDVCRLDGGKIVQANNKPIIVTNSGHLTCGAGVTIAQVLARAIPRGWMLSVVPGTQYATIGGCIANDVHGKNQPTHGTFGNHVTQICLCHSNHFCLWNHGDPLFHATIGGLGLTGFIESCTIKLEPIKSRPSFLKLFPLDYTPYWWLMQRFGLVQYQCVGTPTMIEVIRSQIRQHSWVTSTKTFGDTFPSVGMLSFARPGYAIAMDFYRPKPQMIAAFDYIVTRYGGAVNPSKYAMSAEMFRHSFPRWKEFAQYVDPGFSSNFWERVK